jgi:hypothetical protein
MSLLAPLVITILIIGFSTSHKIGYFVFQSTTSGANLIMSANDKAYGGVMTHVFSDTTSIMYIDKTQKLTFVAQDSIYKARAIAWIKQHPVKYTGLFFKKIAGLYSEDSWADRPLLGGDGFIGKYATGEISKKEFLLRAVHMGLGSIVYYVVLLFFVLSLWKNRKKLFSQQGLLLLIIILGTGVTCLFSVSPRYHYPFIFAFILYAAWGIDSWKNGTKPE